jgi:hypothetical protein
MQRADKIIWTIKQDDKEISIGRRVDDPDREYNAGAGMTADLRSDITPRARSAYKLDGSENFVDLYGGRSKSTLKATWLDGTLNLFRKTTLSSPDGHVNSSEDLRLSLSDNGSVLRVIVHNEGPRGPTDMTLVFMRE